VWAIREGDGWRSPTAKFLTEVEIASLNAALGAEEDDLLLVVADEPAVANQVLGTLRRRLAERWDEIRAGSHSLCWIIDWPLFEWAEAEGRWTPLHHPFTSFEGCLTEGDPGAARARAYDLVWNGTEIGGGSIRINDAVEQGRVLALLGIDAEEAEARFGFLLEALRFGAPPHGGIAYGVDRICALAAGADSIRDVIAFPKTSTGGDPLTGAPAPVDATQLRDLGIKLSGQPPRTPPGG